MIYVMLTISTSIVSIDFLDILVPMMTYPFRFATPENRWAELILPHMHPGWISVSDPAAIKGWYEGNTSLYMWSELKPWMVPVCVWSRGDLRDAVRDVLHQHDRPAAVDRSTTSCSSR